MFRDNLFTVIKSLESVARKKTTSSDNRARLNKLLNGDEDVSGLHEFAKGFSKDRFWYLLNEVNSFCEETPATDFILKMALKRTKSILKKMVGTNHPVSKASLARRKDFARRQDEIYEITQEKYKGVIVAPITQILDYRLADSRGECAGYVIVWAQALLSKKDPFGVRHQQGPLFKPIKFNSEVGRKYPDLNHSIVLKKEIAGFQASRDKKLYDCDHLKRIYKSTVSLPALFKSGSDIAAALNKLAVTNKVYYLSVHGGSRGHALGFYLDDNDERHFFDVNTGWFKFPTEELFSIWLDYYFRRKKYDKTYTEFYTFSYGFEVDKKISFKQWITTQPRFLGYKLKSFFEENLLNEKEEVDIGTQYIPRQSEIMHTVDDSFFHRKIHAGRVAYRGIEALVDCSIEDIMKAEKRAFK